MGMAASQARLLVLTARIHDVEYEAQSIQNAKLQLATQEDEVYEKYQHALDATTLTYTQYQNGVYTSVPATFNNLFSVNGANATAENYALVDSRGRLIVPDDVYEGYHEFIDSSYPQEANTFALYMLYGNGNGNIQGDDWDNFLSVADAKLDEKWDEDEHLRELYNAVVPSNPSVIVNNNIQSATFSVAEANNRSRGEKARTDQAATASATVANNSSREEKARTDYPQSRSIANILAAGDTPEAREFMNYFFHKYGQQVFNNEQIPEDDIYQFNYYVRMFCGIQQHGGCISINDFNGPDGDDAANNSEYITAMLQSGRWTIEKFGVDADGNIILKGASVSSESSIAYTTTSQIDKAALAKAEAEYEHALKQINKKDKQFDLALNKLETERNALTKQYESVQKVIKENIDRSFGIFS